MDAPGCSLDEWFEHFLAYLAESGWAEVLNAHGWDLCAETAEQRLPDVRRDQPGFGDFSLEGDRPIAPGEPAHSLLYHAIMSPGVHPTGGAASYPSLEQVDRLENYIYARAFRSAAALEGCEAVTLAYEYRPRTETPHHKHADLVFSRTGVARVGTAAHLYDPKRRCFSAEPDNPAGVRAQAVRYAVFLCRPVAGAQQIATMGRSRRGDGRRRFWLPVHKLFSGDNCIVGKDVRVKYEERHIADKLERMIRVGQLKLGKSFDLDRPPFSLETPRDNFVGTTRLAGSIVVSAKPTPIIEPARQDGKIATFAVPKAKRSYFGFSANRRYTSMRVGQQIIWMALDYLVNRLLRKLKRDPVFWAPRNCAEFTNIRHTLDADGTLVDLKLLPRDQFGTRVAAGGYQAVLFADGTAEGVVTARIEGYGNSNNAKPAFSLITAPDFMPKVAGIDLSAHGRNFVIGGIDSLSGGRLVPNLRLKLPAGDETAFSAEDDTAAAAFALSRGDARTCDDESFYLANRGLPDVASDVFAPGWDVTYGRESRRSQPYYHTAGLGSPFMEDVKLCAAANGMWAAAAPDAARTYRRDTRTAIPLCDHELGLADGSALVLEQGATPSRGWDGEHCPYVVRHASGWGVNFASIARADYVTNSLAEHISFSLLRDLSKQEIRGRMSALAAAHDQLRGDIELKNSPYWLVSFVAVGDWAEVNRQLNLPAALPGRNRIVASFRAGGAPGYLLVFATTGDNEEQPADALDRDFILTDRLYAAQVIGAASPTIVPLKIN